MQNVPTIVSIIFIVTTLLTFYFLYRASNRSRVVLAVCGSWLTLQGIVAYTGFYEDTEAFPPRFLLLVLPALLFIIVMFLTGKGRQYLDNLDVRKLTLLHIVRIPVELVLYWLFAYGTIPELMTFEGRNFDIFSGITAPFILYYGYVVKRISAKLILAWNIICVLLLFNIVINAILSAPFRFQQFAFDQPNVAVLHFPFTWLPGFIVPAVLFSHLVCIKRLLRKTDT